MYNKLDFEAGKYFVIGRIRFFVQGGQTYIIVKYLSYKRIDPLRFVYVISGSKFE